MGGQTLAYQWLKENGHTWSGKPAKQASFKKIKRPKPFFVFALDRLAWEQLEDYEKGGAEWQRKPRRNRKRFGELKRQALANLKYGTDFNSAHVDVNQLHCLLSPGIRSGRRASELARDMCARAHGAPALPDMVARHLCGNGHWNCVNPAHLAWGTHEENSNDTTLHWERPKFRPMPPEDVCNAIKEDPRHPNILAVQHNLPTYMIVRIKVGEI